MKSKHHRLPLTILTFVAAFGCGADTPHYTPERDREAMIQVLSTFEDAASGLSLSLCEDVAAAEAQANGDCQIDHVVRPDGLGEDHRESHSNIGCGGCPFAVVAFVQGQLAGGPIDGEPLFVSGQVYLGTDGNGAYGFPFYVSLSCDDEAASCSLDGMLRKDGSLDLSLGLRGADGEHSLTRTAPAVCTGG